MQVLALVFVVGSIIAGCNGYVLENEYTGSAKVHPLETGQLKLADQYHLKAVMYLPFIELEEPMEAWVDLVNNKSRIDYYHGTMKVYQDGNVGEHGIENEIAPVTKSRESANVPTCLQIKGNPGYILGAQRVLPDTDEFKMVGREVYMGDVCEKWQFIEKKFAKVNTYTMYVKRENGKAIPRKFMMKGYNNIFENHYDHYYYLYSDFHEGISDPSVFVIDPKLNCPASTQSKHTPMRGYNPMRDLIERDQTHINDAFESFKKTHNKSYTDDNEHEKRMDNFRHNLRFIHSKNREGLPYTLAVNHLADLSPEEMKALRGRKHDPQHKITGTFTYTPKDVKALPEYLDWRIAGAVTQVKDQATCGSCWAFGAAGAIEGAYFVKYGQRHVFSEQALVDCSWGDGNSGCDGGMDYRAYEYIMKVGGLPTEEAYGRYLGIDGFCHIWNTTKTAMLEGYMNVKAGDEQGLMVALHKYGPISIAINANPLGLSFYSSGVFYDPMCTSTDVNHAVLLVGYGTLHGTPYWIVKNSWSTHWGNDGYIIVSRENNNCGISTAPTFPILK